MTPPAEDARCQRTRSWLYYSAVNGDLMLAPPPLAVWESEGGGLADGNARVGGEPPEKQINSAFDPESLVREPLCQMNERSLMTQGKWNVPMMSS